MSSAAADRARAGRRAPPRVAVVATTAGAPFEDIAVTGTGAPPSVVLHGPGGEAVTPTALGPSAASAVAVALPVPKTDTTYVMVRRPGSRHLDGVSSSRFERHHIGERGPRVPRAGDQSARQWTRHGASADLFGNGAAGPVGLVRGTVARHVPRARPRRRCTRHASLHPSRRNRQARTIDAIVSDDGVQRGIVPVASYRAPPPVIPGRVHGLKIHRRGRRFQIRFGTAAGASYYLLTARSRDGRHLLRLIRRSGHSLTLPVLGYNDHLRITVVGVSALGRRGRAASVRA